MDQLASFLARYAYWGLLLGIAAENLGLPFPGEVLVLLAGAMASRAHLNFFAIAAATACGAMLGDHGSYLIGRKGGGYLLNRYCRLTLCSRDCGAAAERFFHRFGAWMVTLARFVPGVGTFATPFAGMSGMAYGKFLLADWIGAILWAVFLAALGTQLGSALAWVLDSVLRFGGIAIVTLAAAFVLVVVRRVRKVRRHGLLTLPSDLTQSQGRLETQAPLCSAPHLRR